MRRRASLRTKQKTVVSSEEEQGEHLVVLSAMSADSYSGYPEHTPADPHPSVSSVLTPEVILTNPTTTLITSLIEAGDVFLASTSPTLSQANSAFLP